MRWIVASVLLLVASGWIASAVIRSGATPVVDHTGGWRRTSQGWERASWWQPEPAARAPVLHPLALCLAEIGLTLLGFALFRPPVCPAPIEGNLPPAEPDRTFPNEPSATAPCLRSSRGRFDGAATR